MTLPSSDTILTAFHHARATFPYYSDILAKRGINGEDVVTHDDFLTKVPILSKEDIFGVYGFENLVSNDAQDAYVSAIVSSGTSGLFSFGLLTARDVASQRIMVDTMMETFFNAKERPPLIINALPMGVSFTSSYQVIPTSVRADIALKVLTTLGHERHTIIVTDPHFMKKLLEDGVASGVTWGKYDVSFIIGGTASSDSSITYFSNIMNEGRAEEKEKNQILGTMGVTEVGLNIFGATPDLIALRHILQYDTEKARTLFGAQHDACPELMYHMSSSVHVEICNPDETGIGDIVLTHLDTDLSSMLIRYKTGDKGQFLSRESVDGVVPNVAALPLPIIAVYGREVDLNHPLSPTLVSEMLYRDEEYAKLTTGHFIIPKGTNEPILIHMKKGVQHLPPRTMCDRECIGVEYNAFPRDVELNYENKWKHI